MIHPLFLTVIRRPDLLLKHAANYAELLKIELTSMGLSLAIQIAGAAVALVALLLALGLTGIAIMLGFVFETFHLVLVVVPGVAWMFVLVGTVFALRSGARATIKELKHEVGLDFELLRLIKEVEHESS